MMIMLGWREWVALPDLQVPAIKAKVDSGARTSALHTVNLEVITTDAGERVRFAVQAGREVDSPLLQCEAPLLERRQVTDSGGHQELRPVIETRLALGGVELTMEITLTVRENLKFRMLLGRTAMAGHFTVDPAASYLQGRVA